MEHQVFWHCLCGSIASLHVNVSAISPISLCWAEGECNASKYVGTELLELDQLGEVDILIPIIRRWHSVGTNWDNETL